MRQIWLCQKLASAGTRYLKLCVWVCARVYKKCVHHHRLVIAAGVCALALAALALLFKWSILCLDVQASWHVQKICSDYADGNVEGNMCEPLCNNSIHSHSCLSYYMGKQAIFAAVWNSLPVIFKSPKSPLVSKAGALYWVDIDGFAHYPTEEEFKDIIDYSITERYNITASESFVKRLSRLDYSTRSDANREQQMKNAWLLLQDNEYMMMQFYDKYKIFPELMGSCGPFYAVRGFNTISRLPHLISTDDSLEEWKRRVHIAILIMEFLRRLETKFPEPIYLCDVKLNHFGINDAFDQVTYLDLDAVHTRRIADRLAGDGAKCRDDSECDYLDCRTRCNGTLQRCLEPVLNDNLQLVCEKIFLGWSRSRTLLVPGLLLGRHAPSSLVELLKRCANPQREAELPRAPASVLFHDQMYTILTSLRAEHTSETA